MSSNIRVLTTEIFIYSLFVSFSMDSKKGRTILIIIAVILVIIAISLQLFDGSDVETIGTGSVVQQDGGGKITLEVIPTEVEDKGASEFGGSP